MKSWVILFLFVHFCPFSGNAQTRESMWQLGVSGQCIFSIDTYNNVDFSGINLLEYKNRVLFSGGIKASRTLSPKSKLLFSTRFHSLGWNRFEETTTIENDIAKTRYYFNYLTPSVGYAYVLFKKNRITFDIEGRVGTGLRINKSNYSLLNNGSIIKNKMPALPSAKTIIVSEFAMNISMEINPDWNITVTPGALFIYPNYSSIVRVNQIKPFGEISLFYNFSKTKISNE